jgi:DNA-binding transcriptional LysR family regulator
MDWVNRVGRRIKLRDLHILLAVAKSGSMGKAATDLAISQPVVSKAISQLEHAVGVPLLERGPHGVEPTAYGRALLKCGVAVFDDLRQGVKEIEFLSDPAAGELRIGCTEAGATGFVPTVIDRLARQYPRVSFHVVTADPMALTGRELPLRNVELAIGATPGAAAGPEIETQILFDERQVVMAGANSKWVRARKLALADLLQERWVLPPPGSIARFHIAEAFRAHGLTLPAAQVLSLSMPLTHHLLATGRFLSIQPIEMARLARHLPLRILDVRFGGVPRAIGIMTLRNRAVSPLAKLFIECAREMASGLGTRDRRSDRRQHNVA